MKSTLKKNQTSKRDAGMPGARSVNRVNQHRSFAFYGRSGTGKTTLASTFPGPIILLDIRDEGTDSIADVKDLEVKEIESFDDLEEAYWWLHKDEADKYSTVVIDTVSQLQQLTVKEMIGDKGRGGKKAGDWGSMTKQDWGAVSAKMKEWIVNFRDLTKLGYQVVFIAQDRVFNLGDDEDVSDDQIAPEVGPALSPAIAKVLNAAVSVIGNTFIRSRIIKKEVKSKKKRIEKLDYCLRIGPNSVYVTKVRKPRDIEAPSFIMDPTYEDILDIIKGKE